MSYCLVFEDCNLLAAGTTRAAALRNAAKVCAGAEEERPFNPAAPRITVQAASRGAYQEVRRTHGSTGRLRYDQGLGKFVVDPSWT
jgi:hypothetical protein